MNQRRFELNIRNRQMTEYYLEKFPKKPTVKVTQTIGSSNLTIFIWKMNIFFYFFLKTFPEILYRRHCLEDSCLQWKLYKFFIWCGDITTIHEFDKGFVKLVRIKITFSCNIKCTNSYRFVLHQTGGFWVRVTTVFPSDRGMRDLLSVV